MTSKKWIAQVGAALLATAPLLVQAAGVSPECRSAFKSQRISLVVPFSAGGGYDTYARAFVPVLEQVSGARVSVSNLPGAGGLLAMKAVANAGSDQVKLGFFELISLLQTSELDKDIRLENFTPLGTIASEVQAWVARPDFELTPGRQQPLVVSVTDARGNMIEVGIAAHVLGLPFRFTTGYKGSAERMSAILRREVDLSSNSITSVVKAVQGGDLKASLVLSDKPEKALPGVPYLAGKGGLIDQWSVNQKSALKREDAMRLGHAVVDMSRSVRVIYVSNQVQGGKLACLGSLVEDVLFSESFAKASEAMGRPVQPLNQAATRALAQRVLESSRGNNQLIEQLLVQALR